jgi:carbamoyl-phosphate synthase large subunit
MRKVLFTGGGGAGNEALFRLLGNQYMLYFGDADVDAIDPAIPKERRHKLPLASDPEFITKMLELCGRLGIDILVPGVDEELRLLALCRGKFTPTCLMLPHEDYIKFMLDKLEMINNLSERQIPVPRTLRLSDDFYGMSFPCISKPRRGRGSRDVCVLDSYEEAVALKAKKGALAKDIVVQEKIEGVEYTVQMLADAHGLLQAIVPVKVGIKRGITIRAETEYAPCVIAACHAIHKAIPASGCYNIQLIMTAEGKVLPFEINPRISTTLCLVVAAGVDPISIFLGDKKRNGDELLRFATGVRLHRHWSNHFYE